MATSMIHKALHSSSSVTCIVVGDCAYTTDYVEKCKVFVRASVRVCVCSCVLSRERVCACSRMRPCVLLSVRTCACACVRTGVTVCVRECVRASVRVWVCA